MHLSDTFSHNSHCWRLSDGGSTLLGVVVVDEAVAAGWEQESASDDWELAAVSTQTFGHWSLNFILLTFYK